MALNLTEAAKLSTDTLAKGVLETFTQVSPILDRIPLMNIAGNAYDEADAHGVLVHRYGPHIFHTNAERIFAWLSRFTAWRPYEHRVRGVVDG